MIIFECVYKMNVKCISQMEWNETRALAQRRRRKLRSRKRWKINEIFRWDGKCLWHSTSYYATAQKAAAPATYDSLMGIKSINFRMVFGLWKTSFMHFEIPFRKCRHIESFSLINISSFYDMLPGEAEGGWRERERKKHSKTSRQNLIKYRLMS